MGRDLEGLAEEVAELVEVVDGHAQEHQPRIVGVVLPILLPGLARAHLDGGRDERPKTPRSISSRQARMAGSQRPF